MGHFDAAIVNFLVEEEETPQIMHARKKAFGAVKPKKVGSYDYIFNRSKKVYTDADVFGEIKDDTEVDLVKVMQRLQVDKERDEVFEA